MPKVKKTPAQLAAAIKALIKASGLNSDISIDKEDFGLPYVETPAELARRKKQEKESAARRRELAKKDAFAKTPAGKLEAALAKISTLETQKTERDKAQAFDMTTKQRELREVQMARDALYIRVTQLTDENTEQKALVSRLLDLIEKVLTPPTVAPAPKAS